MLEYGEFSYLYNKCLDVLKQRIETIGPDEMCLVLEILCDKFHPEGSTSKSWKRVPTISTDILSLISREELEELIEVDYSPPTTNLHERAIMTDWDSVLDGLVTRNEPEEENVRK